MAAEGRRDGSKGIPEIQISACKPYEMGFTIGIHFEAMIRSRVACDPYLSSSLQPFANTKQGQHLVHLLSKTNSERYPEYWDELRGLADGSGVPFLSIILMNFRKEISPFLPDVRVSNIVGAPDQCSDILICSDELAVMAHNEDGDASLRNHVYIVNATLENGVSFFAYTCAGELPSCCFGFNSNGVAFTLDSVPPAPEEVVPGGIGRNFVSRDLLESSDIHDALRRVQIENLSAGHNYNIMDVNSRKMFTTETASRGRASVREINRDAFYHANMYQHLSAVKQVGCQPSILHCRISKRNSLLEIVHQSSVCRQKRVAELPMNTLQEVLTILADDSNQDFPVYMQGPQLHTLCTAIFDMNEKSLTILTGKPSSMSVLRRVLMTTWTAKEE
ncbi:isopenicillin-N N-acyltransferase like protein [Marchantia polymorpha subsp. ruderalis]